MVFIIIMDTFRIVYFFLSLDMARPRRNKKKEEIPTDWQGGIHECCSWIPEIKQIQTARLMPVDVPDLW